MFYTFTNFKVKTIDNVKKEIGTNVFVISLLRSQLMFEGKNIELSELVSRYIIEGDTYKLSIIQNNITTLMKQMYKKDACWKLTIPNQNIITSKKDCVQLSKEEMTSATVIIPGVNNQAYTVRFETTT